VIIEAIIRQSVLDGNKPYQQLSNLMIDGLSTKEETLNTDNGKLYGTFRYADNFYVLKLFKDVLRLNEVARATSETLGQADVVEQNDSGLAGTVNFAQYLSEDGSIEVICFLSRDKDLPMQHIESLKDYDPDNGFVDYHLEAFRYIKDFLITRFNSKLNDPAFIDTNRLGTGTGGYNLARCNNLHVLKDASAHYAFFKIAEKQFVEPGSIWEKRYKDSSGICAAHLNRTELAFDMNQDRVDDDRKSLRTYKIGRA